MRRTFIILCAGWLVVAGLSLGVAADSYALASPAAVDTPDRTVTVGGNTYQVTNAVRVAGGTPFTIRPTAPNNATFDLYLYNSDQAVTGIKTDLTDGSDPSFATDDRPPGSYVVALFYQGRFEAILPVVVMGYRVSATHDGPVRAGEALTVTAEIREEPAAPNVSAVEAVVTNASTDRVVTRVPMDRQAAGTYETSVTVDAAGAHKVYVNVRGEQRVRGQRELLGFSDAVSLTVTPGATQTATPSATLTPTSTPTPTTPSTTAAPTTADPITPRAATATPTQTSAQGGVHLWAALVVGVLLLLIGLASRVV